FRPSSYRGVFRFLWHQKLFTACLLAVVGCWYTGFPLSLIPTRAGTAAGAGPGGWPAYRGGPAGLGRAAGLGPAGVRGRHAGPAGRRVAELRTQSHVESPACIEGGRVYVGPADDGVYCVDLAADENGQPVVHWHLDPAKFVDCESSPLVVDGTVYFGLGEEGT